ncbi:unnamed protein product [Closterium sp. NIES-53]
MFVSVLQLFTPCHPCSGLCLAYVASQANTADVFTKALQPCDHQLVEVVAAVGVVAGVGALVAAVVAAVGVAVVAAVGVVAVGLEVRRGEDLAVAGGSSSSSVGARPLRPNSFGDCYLCVPPDPSIEAASLGASESALPGTTSVEALHTFTLDSSASRFFFRDSTTLTPLSAPVPVRLADPSGAKFLPVRPLFSRVWRFCPAHCQVFTSPRSLQTWCPRQVRLHPPARIAPCRTRLSCGTTDLVTPPYHAFVACTPSPHSSSFPLTTAPLQTLHMDVWGPACVCGQGRERYFLLVVDDYTRYTTVFPLRSKGQVIDVSIPWIRAVRLQLRERFRQDLPVLRLHSDIGGEFSSDLLREFCRGEGILQSFTLPASPQQNGIAVRRIDLVMEVAQTSTIHAAAPHFLRSFVVRYAAHQLNLWPCVSLPETSPTLRWTGKVGDALVFRVWGSRAFVRDTSADKLSARAIPYVFLGFPPDAPGWQFYHPTSRRVFPSKDVMFDESVPLR